MFIYRVFVRRDNTFPDEGLCVNNTFSNALFVTIHCVWSLQNFWHRPKKTIDADYTWVDTVLEKGFFH